jgi:hypothetical protein
MVELSSSVVVKGVIVALGELNESEVPLECAE